MSRTHRNMSADTSRGSRSWPVLLLLLAVVLVPTVCVLWFMNEVTQNEHLAVRKKLTNVYRSQLPLIREHLRSKFWESVEAVDNHPVDAVGATVFHDTVRAGLADSLICYDTQDMQTYPQTRLASPVEDDSNDSAWKEANRFEYVQKDFLAAANAYAAIEQGALAKQPPAVNAAARALQSQARCYFRAGHSQEAIYILDESLGQVQFTESIDLEGRLIVADAELRALELLVETHGTSFSTIADRLRERLSDYSNERLCASQRLFLMKRLQSLIPDQVDFPTLQAEELAQHVLDVQSSPTTHDVLQTTGLPNVWQIATPSGRALLLFETSRLTARMREWIESQGMPPEVTVSVLPPDSEISSESVIASLNVGERLPGWRITLMANDQDFFRLATTRRITAYTWIGILVIATTTVLAVLIARAIRKQNQLAKLKNDLVATISHELKTPLASMRLLVDTLLDSPNWNETQAREYLQLIGKENTRLSRLIDNFLAFSRIERNKYRFDFVKTSVDDIIQESKESVQERFHSADCQFDVRIDADLPLVSGDQDALVTVVLNLLDNAYKYSGAKKHIELSAFTENDHICIEVQDNGVGLSQRDAKRIFKRFYQADRRLSRGNEGCGLGLSIVQYIVDAHGGTVRVISDPGVGSRFIVKLPAVIIGMPSAEEAVA